MTLSSTTIKDVFNGDGVTKSFATTWVFWNSSEVQAILVSSSGLETTWTEGTEYTVTGGGGAVGTVAVSTGPTDYTPASGSDLLLRSNVLDIQETALPAGGVFPSTSVEQELDRTVRRIQQQTEELGRAMLLSVASTFSDIGFPDPVSASFIRWKSTLDGFENATISGSTTSIGIPVAIGEGGTGSSTAPAALVALGIDGLSGNISSGDIAANSIDVDKLAAGTDGELITWGSTGGPTVVAVGSSGHILISNGAGAAPSFQEVRRGKTLQVVSTFTSSSEVGIVATGTTAIPNDNTIPQDTEGDQYMTLDITPHFPNSSLVIDVSALCAHSSTLQNISLALFQSSNSDAIASQAITQASADFTNLIVLSRYITAGSTTTLTFNVRAGGVDGPTTTFNGGAGNQLHGGVVASHITIAEIST